MHALTYPWPRLLGRGRRRLLVLLLAPLRRRAAMVPVVVRRAEHGWLASCLLCGVAGCWDVVGEEEGMGGIIPLG